MSRLGALLLTACAQENPFGDDAAVRSVTHACRNHMALAANHADSVAVLDKIVWYGGSAYPACAMFLDSLKRKP